MLQQFRKFGIMKKINRIISVFAVAFAGAVLAVFLYSKFIVRDQQMIFRESMPIHLTNQVVDDQPRGQLPDLTQAAEKSVHAVVHIEVKMHEQSGSREDSPLYEFFFGPGWPERANPRGQREQPQFSMGPDPG